MMEDTVLYLKLAGLIENYGHTDGITEHDGRLEDLRGYKG